MLINAIAIDDELPAIGIIKSYVDKVPFIRLVDSFTDPKEGLEYIYSHQPDLVFLDINMPGMKGTELAKIIQPFGKSFIFTTAYSEFALQGYELQALDYLLKPFSFERFLTSLNRAYQEIVRKKGEETSVFFKDSYDWIRVNLSELKYVKSDGNLLFIHTKTGNLSTRMTMQELIAILPSDTFMRIHKSWLVNLNAIEKLEKHQVWIEGDAVPLANNYREMVEKRLLKKP
ncbi:LytR/AlgR family response regulator transcription factor [Arthrospiribacter ruber]|uniref:LytR/AlgR family response regulator transcription factor n=1 Tax=Arthrospiribacter ruber TaxID=2487934 RepID=UPI001FEA425B|nr:LytTR family DNA-binding domain-containing protein [Arthrospiribacter ruber]